LSILLSSQSDIHAQFRWAHRVAGTTDLPEGELNVGLALDTDDNCFVTGFFDGTNDFGGVILTNQSAGGSDMFVAKYSSNGALQWVQRAGGTNINYGRSIGVDTNGNVYVTGGYQGPAKFGGVNLPASVGESFFLAKYDAAGTAQWVQRSTGGSDDVYGIGLTADAAGNTYALSVVDHLGSGGTSITFGSVTVPIPNGVGSPVTILLRYDATGAAQWAQLMSGAEEVYATSVAVDSTGNVYVHGTFLSTFSMGTSNLVVSAGSSQNAFLAKFNNSGTLLWALHPEGGNSGEGGVAVDGGGNIYASGDFDGDLDFGSGVVLTNVASSSGPLLGDAFLAKYNGSGVIQWARSAGDTNGGFYWRLAVDEKTNIYAAGFLGLTAAVAKYNSTGLLLWTQHASGPPANPISSAAADCAVNSAGQCYVEGIYVGPTTFGAYTLQPQDTYDFFLAKLDASPLTLGIVWSNSLPLLSVLGEIDTHFALEYVPSLSASMVSLK
jgi:hypothetical protein